MKKTIILSIIFILIGFFIGNKIEMKQILPEKYFFVQEDLNHNQLEDTLADLQKKVLEFRNNQIHVYVGITKDEKVANKILKLYQKKQIPIQIEEVWLNNEELRINIEQLDYLVKKASTYEEITKIEEVALASYEEILKTRE